MNIDNNANDRVWLLDDDPDYCHREPLGKNDTEYVRATDPPRKRETDGQYAFDGNLQRLCVCGHSLAVHSAGSPADCLLYSLPENDPQRQHERAPIDCGCKKFRLTRAKSNAKCCVTIREG